MNAKGLPQLSIQNTTKTHIFNSYTLYLRNLQYSIAREIRWINSSNGIFQKDPREKINSKMQPSVSFFSPFRLPLLSLSHHAYEHTPPSHPLARALGDEQEARFIAIERLMITLDERKSPQCVLSLSPPLLSPSSKKDEVGGGAAQLALIKPKCQAHPRGSLPSLSHTRDALGSKRESERMHPSNFGY